MQKRIKYCVVLTILNFGTLEMLNMIEIEKAMQQEILKRRLPQWAIKKNPAKQNMSAINPIAMTSRLNEAFGVHGWSIESSIEQVKELKGKYKDGREYEKIMIVAKVKVTFADGSYKETYGGNDNADLGDAYKGAVTDGLTKICSWLGIGAHVWRNDIEGSAPDEDSNAGRGISELVEALISKEIGSDKQRAYIAKRLSSSSFNKTRMALINKLNNKEVSISDAIEKLK